MVTTVLMVNKIREQKEQTNLKPNKISDSGE